MLICPLCEHSEVVFYYEDKRRPYWQCQQCQLVHVPTQFHLDHNLEKAEYDKHENSLNDEGYLTFLSRVSDPVIKYVTSENKDNLSGLDFGCGPSPALAHGLQKAGLNVDVYDPYYYPNQDVLTKQYDVITCTEVIEHFNHPKSSLELLLSLLKPNGLLVIMTKLVINQERFKDWHYKNDPTHVSFFSVATFEYIAQKYQLTYVQKDKDVAFFYKRNDNAA